MNSYVWAAVLEMAGRASVYSHHRPAAIQPSPAQPSPASQPGQAELRMNECWAGLAQAALQHTPHQSYRVTELQSTLTNTLMQSYPAEWL